MPERKKRRIEVKVGKTINLGNFENVKLEASVSTVIADKADIEKAFDSLWEKCNLQIEDQVDLYESAVDEPDETEEIPEPEEEVEVETEKTLEDEEDITEEGIEAMSKKELVQLCKDAEGLEDIDTSKGVKALRALIIDALFEEEPEENDPEEADPDSGTEETGGNDAGDDEWGDEDWED